MSSAKDIYLGLGSNIGNALDIFNQACHAIQHLAPILKKSLIYQSEPYGYQDQNNFHNAVILIQSDLPPLRLLEKLQSIEKKLGKVVIRENGPRKIDLDIIAYGEAIICNDMIQIPHAHMHTRDFVLLPLAEIAPDWTHPQSGLGIKQLIADLPQRYITGAPLPWA